MRLLPENTYLADPALRAVIGRLRPSTRAWAEPQLTELGGLAPGELLELGEECERNPAQLRSIDPWGERVDEVVYPAAWGRLGSIAARFGLAGLPYEKDALALAGPEVRIVHAALCYLFEPGTATYMCPVSMTDAAARVLSDFGDPRLRDELVPHLTARDPASAWTAGQWMTEQQGGSDVGANLVEARPQDGGWRIWGRKYFCSNVGGQLVLALARPSGAGPGTRGLGLFVIPRHLPDGARNAYRIDRLKDKLGTRAMATGEVTLEGAHAWPVGSLERGFAQMTPMLNITRLHNSIASAASLRRGLQLARGYAASRSAFGRRLEEQPLQRLVLTELALQAEAALLMTMRVAELMGRLECGTATAEEGLLFRAGTSLTKLYTARQAVAGASETVEAFGGAGYMEDTGIARHLRNAQVLPIWEGTTNVLALDTLRVLGRNPDVAEAFLDELTRLGSRGRTEVARLLGEVAAAGSSDAAQRHGRRLAFAMSEAWIDGLFRRAAASGGGREAALAELWETRADGVAPPRDHFAVAVDGA